jgi:hypothetical protein
LAISKPLKLRFYAASGFLIDLLSLGNFKAIKVFDFTPQPISMLSPFET